MSAFRFLLLLVALASISLFGGTIEAGALLGRLEGNTYFSSTGSFRVTVPVLPELGGRVVDTANAVTFQDNFNVFATIAAVPMDATQRWEFTTRGTKDYLTYFFSNLVMPDFQQAFVGSRVESAKFAPGISDGVLIAYILLPGGSMFSDKLAFVGPNEVVRDAKRGNLVCVRNGWVFIFSIELAERVLERGAYHKTVAEEDQILRQRLVDLLAKTEITVPPAPSLH
jgi:hypothetical protein